MNFGNSRKDVKAQIVKARRVLRKPLQLLKMMDVPRNNILLELRKEFEIARSKRRKPDLVKKINNLTDQFIVRGMKLGLDEEEIVEWLFEPMEELNKCFAKPMTDCGISTPDGDAKISTLE